MADEKQTVTTTVEKTDEEIKVFQVTEKDLTDMTDRAVKAAKEEFEKSGQETIKQNVREAFKENQTQAEHEIVWEKLNRKQKAFRAMAAVQWYRGLLEKDWTKAHEAFEMCGGERMKEADYVRAHNETTATAGGTSVAPVFMTDLMYQTMNESMLWTKTNVIPVSTNSIYRTALNAGVTSYWGVSESTAATHTQRTQTQRNIPVYNMRTLTSFSLELLDDAQRFYAETINLLRESIKYLCDQVLFTVTTPTDGILSADLVDSIDNATTYDMKGYQMSGTNPTFDALVGILETLAEEDEEGAEFYLPRSTKFKCLGIKDQQLMPVLGSMGLTKGFGKELLGYPINTSRVLSTPSADGTKYGCYGNLKKTVTVYDRQQMTAKVIDQGTVNSANMGETGGLGLALFYRFGFDVFVPKYNDGSKTGLTRLIHVA